MIKNPAYNFMLWWILKLYVLFFIILFAKQILFIKIKFPTKTSLNL